MQVKNCSKFTRVMTAGYKVLAGSEVLAPT